MHDAYAANVQGQPEDILQDILDIKMRQLSASGSLAFPTALQAFQDLASQPLATKQMGCENRSRLGVAIS